MQVPDHVWQSVVSAEDRSFFQHPGLDPRGLARAVLFAGTRGGGSTITQQLVKNLFVSDSKTISRYVAGFSFSCNVYPFCSACCLRSPLIRLGTSGIEVMYAMQACH